MQVMRFLMVCTNLCLNVAGSIDASRPIVGPTAEQFVLVATQSHRKYKIFVDVPREAAPASGYPVIYFLDGDTTFLLAAGASRLQATTENALGPALIVAIGYDAEEPQISKERFFDLTPPPSDHARIFESPAGGADSFAHFLRDDLKPLISRKYEINAERQALVGHSLGGLFVLHVAFSFPNLFSDYVAGSPSVWWDNQSILKEAKNYRNASQGGTRTRLLIAVGSNEPGQMLDGVHELAKILQDGPKFEACFVEFTAEDHMSVIPAIISRSIGFFLSGRSC
jgi:uncharacterized protein